LVEAARFELTTTPCAQGRSASLGKKWSWLRATCRILLARAANVPVKTFPNGTLLTSAAPLAQTPISSQMVSYPCNPSRESPCERRTSWGEHDIVQSQKVRACSIGKAAKSANKLLTGHSEAIKTKGDVLDVTCWRLLSTIPIPNEVSNS